MFLKESAFEGNIDIVVYFFIKLIHLLKVDESSLVVVFILKAL